jgi:hypothetical protein
MPVIAGPDEPNDPQNPDDEIQSLLNEAKRDDISQRYGARFFHSPRSRIPPEIEGAWLAHIEEMELRMETATMIPLREFVGASVTPALDDLPDSVVENELESLLERFAQHNVFVDFPDDVEAPEAYRFIVEELLDEYVHDLQMPGLLMHIVYRRRG